MALWGKTDTDAAKPKYLSDTLRNDQQVSDLDSTLGVSITEAQVAANIAKGIKTPGWTMYRTYTDAQGNVRNKAEVLVAMNQFAVDGSDNDTLAPEITITVQPSNVTVNEPSTATFSVTATRTGTGTLTYQWQKAESTNLASYSNIVGATSASYTTGATTYADDNGDKFRVVVSLPGAESVGSNAVTLGVSRTITITAQPVDANITEGDDVTLSVTATTSSPTTVSYEWFRSTDGGTTFDSTAVTTQTFPMNAVPVSANGYQFYVVVSAEGAAPVTSNTVTLNVAGI